MKAEYGLRLPLLRALKASKRIAFHPLTEGPISAVLRIFMSTACRGREKPALAKSKNRDNSSEFFEVEVDIVEFSPKSANFASTPGN
jgi:hypothetical protein